MTKRNFIFISALFFFILGVYLYTLLPTIDLHDSGDMITGSYYLGVIHPPGYPLYCGIGRIFSLLPCGNIAWKYNFLSALSGSLAVGLTAGIAQLLWGNLTSGILAGLALGFARTFWLQSNIAEKYTMYAAFLTSLIFSLLLWESKLKRAQKIYQWQNPEKLLFFFSFLMGIAFCHHFQTLFLIPPTLYLFWQKRTYLKKLKWQKLLLLPAFFILPLFLYAYLSIRANFDTPCNWGSPNTFNRFLAHITAQEYYHYFTKDVSSIIHNASLLPKIYLPWQFSLFGCILIILGVILAAFKYPEKAIFLLLLSFSCLLHSSRYMIHNIEDYYITIYIAGVLFIACLLAKLSLTKAKYFSFIIFSFFLAYISSKNYYYANMRNHYYAVDYGNNILSPLALNPVVFIKGDTLAFPLWYLHYVERARSDAKLIDILELRYNYYAKKFLPKDKLKGVPEDVRKLDASLQQEIVKERFSYIVSGNKGHSFYLPFDDSTGASFYLLPEGILHRVLDKSKEGAIKRLPPLNLCYRVNWEDYKDERTLHNLYNYAVAHSNRAHFYLNLGKLKLAEKEFKFALKANPSHTPSLYNLALIYKDKGDYEKAFWFASKIKGLAQRFYTKGLIYMDKKDYPKAVIYLKRAAEKDKNKSFIYIQLGNAYQLQGKLKEAISAYKRALELEPDNIQLKTTIKRLSATD